MTIRWGIVGIGGHADHRMAPAIGRARDTELASVCSRDLGRARAFADKHHAKRAYASLEEMLHDPGLDVLYVATPNNLHAEQTVQAAKAGKHVFCEKPMALHVADCERMIQACRDHKVKLGVNFQNRFHPAHVEARRLIRSGDAGEIHVVKAQYARGPLRNDSRGPGWRFDPTVAGAGSLVGGGLHPIDLLRFLLDREIDEVRALTDANPPQRPVEEMSYIILSFQGGTTGVVICGHLVPRSDNDAVIYGTKAKITCLGTVGMPLQGELLVEGDAVNMRMSFPTDDPVSGLFVRAVEAFNQSIREDRAPPSSGEDGLEIVRVVQAILESSRQGKAVKIAR